MQNAIQWLFILAPLLMFAAVMGFGFLVIHRFVDSLREKLTGTLTRKEIHLQSSWGSIDVHPGTAVDPRLAKILLYPGAAPMQPGVPEYEAELRLLNHHFKGITAQYWTSTPEQIVWEFYQRELPDWQVVKGRELTKDAGDHIQAIAIRSSGDRTIIEIAIRVRAEAAGVAAGG